MVNREYAEIPSIALVGMIGDVRIRGVGEMRYVVKVHHLSCHCRYEIDHERIND
jgi:hypothetical protein